MFVCHPLRSSFGSPHCFSQVLLPTPGGGISMTITASAKLLSAVASSVIRALWTMCIRYFVLSAYRPFGLSAFRPIFLSFFRLFFPRVERLDQQFVQAQPARHCAATLNSRLKAGGILKFSGLVRRQMSPGLMRRRGMASGPVLWCR